MSQKTKLISVIVIILLVTIGVGVYFFKKNKAVVPAPQTMNSPQTQNNQQPTAPTQPIVKDEQAVQSKPQDKKETIIEGKARSINEKQFFIELADGKGAAINISPTTPVRTEGDDKVGNLSLLKMGMMVSVKVEQGNNAVDILIKK